MNERTFRLAMLGAAGIAGWAGQVNGAGIQDIATVVVIYAENRSFDSLYGSFPGADGLAQAAPAASSQLDRDGSVSRNCPRYGTG